MRGQATLDGHSSSDPSGAVARPAAIAVFAASQPIFRPASLDRSLVIGRLPDADVPEDEQASRKHAELVLASGALRVRDLGSRNGTYVNGARVDGSVTVELPCVVRTGHTVFLVVADDRRMAGGITADDRGVVGPALRGVLARIERAAAVSETLLVTGETGTGKERAARAFHEAGGSRRGTLLAVNCATIAHGVAERLLFGTVKGAFSGADVAADGYIVAANGGTLFLDEVGELDPLVQPKLLRVLETREVLPLGASRPVQVTTRFVFATMRKLRAAMQDGRFRADLFYRISREEVELPPLHERREEIPYLLAMAIGKVAPELAVHAKLVEATLLRTWPGNVRELIAAAERAAARAREDGKSSVRDGHLDPAVGFVEAPAKPAPAITKEVVERAIADHDGNLSAAARRLGLHRSQFYRLLRQFGIER